MQSWLRRNFALLVILILFLALTLPFLGSSFWYEETLQALSGFGFENIWQFLQPPFFYLVLNLAGLFSTSEWWLRLWTALLPSILTVIGIYLTGRKLGGKNVGILTALLLITNSFFNYYATELGYYAWSTCFTVWSWFVLLERFAVGQDSYQIKRGGKLDKFFKIFPISHDLFIFILLTILGLYTSYLYIFVFLAQLIYMLYKKDFSSFRWSLLVSLIAYLPWLPFAWQQIQTTQTLQSVFPGLNNLIDFTILQVPALTFGKFIFGIIDIQANIFYLLILTVLALIFIFLLFYYPKKAYQKHGRNLFLTVYLAVMPFLLAWLVSLIFPALQVRRVIFLLPYFYLFVSYFFLGMVNKKRTIPALSYLGIGTFLLINLYGTFSYFNNENLQREDWRSSIMQIKNELPVNQTLVLFAYQDQLPPWGWYTRQDAITLPTISTQSYNLELDPSALKELIPYINNYRYVVVFDYLRVLTDPQNEVQQILESDGYKIWKTIERHGVGNINIYVKTNTTYTEHYLPIESTT